MYKGRKKSISRHFERKLLSSSVELKILSLRLASYNLNKNFFKFYNFIHGDTSCLYCTMRVVNSELVVNSEFLERSFLSKRLGTFYDLSTQFLLISQSQTTLNSTACNDNVFQQVTQFHLDISVPSIEQVIHCFNSKNKCHALYLP